MTKGKDKIQIEIIKGVEGLCITLDENRICGNKPWGGGEVINSWEVSVKEIKRILKEKQEEK